MPQVVVVDETDVPDADVAFAVAAVDDQMREDFCPRWPGIPYQPVSFFKSARDLPTASGVSLICSIRDKHDDPGTAAYHSWAGVPFIRIGRDLGVLSVLLSHEILEEVVNPTCMDTFDLGNGLRAAKEVCDPVQGWTYDRKVTILGETRQVPVSAFVLPHWFKSGGLVPPSYYCPGRTDDLLPREIAPGGYIPVLTVEAAWDRILGAGTDVAAITRKAETPTARARRRAA